MSIEEIGDDIRKFILAKPANFKFMPGRNVMVSVNKPSLEYDKRICTFFSTNADFYLEIIFKGSQAEAENREFFNVKAGEELIVSDIIGKIEYKGEGNFLAAGKGVIQFINIFKHLKQLDSLQGNTLAYVVRFPGEIMFERLLRHLMGNNMSITIFPEPNDKNEFNLIDESFLHQKFPSLEKEFYIAGPRKFVEQAADTLNSLNINFQAEIID